MCYEACRLNLVAANDEENALMRNSRAEDMSDVNELISRSLVLLCFCNQTPGLPASRNLTVLGRNALFTQ